VIDSSLESKRVVGLGVSYGQGNVLAHFGVAHYTFWALSCTPWLVISTCFFGVFSHELKVRVTISLTINT